MRRSVQAGFAVELVGTSVAKSFFHFIDLANFLSVSEQAMSNTNFIMLVRMGAIWWYQGYTRDHLMARHVTRLSLAKPLAEIGPTEPVVVFLETGPWTRRLEFHRGRGPSTTMPFAQLVKLGAIHLDEANGEVLDSKALQLLHSGSLHIASEELYTDEEAKRRLHIGSYEVPSLLHDDASGANQWWADLPPSVLKPLSWRSSLALYNAGVLVLLMGMGSVVQWLPRGTIPLPGIVENFLYPRRRTFEF